MENGPIHSIGASGEIRPADAGPGTRPAEKLDREKLKKACTEFESLMIFQMMKSMRQSSPQNGFLGMGPGQDIYQNLFDQEMSKSLARRGGLGIGEKIYRQMMQRMEKESPPAQLNRPLPGRRDSE
jgi:Rod binding domain-containing protein